MQQYNVGLIDVDSHNFPNIPLMKISAYYKKKGAKVQFVHWNTLANGERFSDFYNEVFISKIFTESVEPTGTLMCANIHRGGSGYDLKNELPDDIEHTYPDYSLYPKLTKETAFGMLTRGRPRCDHAQSRGGFCITPDKDGCKSIKVADLSEFWDGQKNIVLLDQNILACRDRDDLLKQLAISKALVDFSGGMDVRFLTDHVIDALRNIRVKDFHFAWDNPKENLADQFRLFRDSGVVTRVDQVSVYVLTNFWSTTEEDLFRITMLRDIGFSPYVMIYDKQKFVDSKGNWLPDVADRYSREELIHFKTCQHLQRWCNTRKLIKLCSFDEYEWFRRWVDKGRPVPERGEQKR